MPSGVLHDCLTTIYTKHLYTTCTNMTYHTAGPEQVMEPTRSPGSPLQNIVHVYACNKPDKPQFHTSTMIPQTHSTTIFNICMKSKSCQFLILGKVFWQGSQVWIFSFKGFTTVFMNNATLTKRSWKNSTPQNLHI